MQKIAKFHKISQEQFVADWRLVTRCSENEAKLIYERIRLPRRATVGSAGYDFFTPEAFTLVPHETILIPTGVCAEIADGWVLQLFPRSGLGFKYSLQMDNTVGIIDSDYYHAENGGHIFVKMTNCSRQGKALSVGTGEAFVQGIFLPFGITEDDDADGQRQGGFGSTTTKSK